MANRNNIVIVLEGPTNSGKTSCCKSIKDKLTKKNIPCFNLNDYLDTDKHVTEVKKITTLKENSLDGIEELLLYSFRLKRKLFYLQKLLEENTNSVILIDRFYISILSLIVGVRKISPTLVKALLLSILEGFEPDLLILLDIEISKLKLRQKSKEKNRKFSDIDLYIDDYRTAFKQTYDELTIDKQYINTTEIPLNFVVNKIYNQILIKYEKCNI
ncbi:nucleoside/nucleotide kinase family protein [Ferruginibacter sp.]